MRLTKTEKEIQFPYTVPFSDVADYLKNPYTLYAVDGCVKRYWRVEWLLAWMWYDALEYEAKIITRKAIENLGAYIRGNVKALILLWKMAKVNKENENKLHDYYMEINQFDY